MKTKDSGRGLVHIGTSGWHYGHWCGPFYQESLPGAKMLRWYTQHFDTVEINNSVYRLPTTEALAGWCRETPREFCFAVKASRYITHNLKLKDPEQSSKKFFSQIARLGRRFGPILFQLPPGWKLNLERLDEFLGSLPTRRRYVFEFRNPTWNVPSVYETLRCHNAAFCIYELAGFQSPWEITAEFIYIRLHGPGGAYQGNYSQEQLKTWARRIRSWRRQFEHIFVYFDNDQSGFAAQNALQLKRILER